MARALAYREPGAAYDFDRLRNNLPSSQPLTFNLFGLLDRVQERDVALGMVFFDGSNVRAHRSAAGATKRGIFGRARRS